MVNKIIIIGASGSGTTTLGKELSCKLKIPHIETDDLFWIPTDTPFTLFRNQHELDILLKSTLLDKDKWILSGSPCGWGDVIMNQLELAIFLSVPTDVRIARIIKREKERFGSRIIEGGDLYESHQQFLNWTKCYDAGNITGRTRKMHETWLKKLSCHIMQFEEDKKINEIIDNILSYPLFKKTQE